MSGRVVLSLLVLGVMGIFAVQGGEYSVWDYLALDRQVQRERDSVIALQHVLDSLHARESAALHDPRVQERIAREQFGMIRPGEHLFRIVATDSQP